MIKAIKDNLFFKWFIWHFKDAPGFILKAAGNFLRFSLNYFSVFPLFRTLFHPWKRLSEGYRKGLANIGENFQVFVLNSFSRLIGFLFRSAVIIVGLIVTTITLVASVLVFLIWFILPFIIVVGFLFSLLLLFNV